MSNNIRKLYRVDKSAVETAYDKHIGLKNNEDYEKWADDTAIKLIEYFEKKYEGVTIELPELREKSGKSILGKIKNLQIERISKLYAVDTVTNKEKSEFIKLIEERIKEEPSLNKEDLIKELNKLIFSDEIDIDSFEKKFIVEGLSKSTKTALLRILVGKIQNAKYKDKTKDLDYLNEKYGEKAAQTTGISEKNIVKYESLRSLKNNIRKFNRLKNENEYLKVNDLRGMKIVVSNVPDDMKTDNNYIKQKLEQRKNSVTNQEKINISQQIIVEMGKEFLNDIENNEELLKETNMQVIPGSSKHKSKSNGYIAEHIKFINLSEPEYTLEMQLKSGYVENKTMGHGSASHENRPGKERILPKSENDEELRRNLEYMCPKFTIFSKRNGKYQKEKFSMLKNVMSYYQEQIEVGSEEYKKIVDLYSNKEENVRS